LQIICNKNNFSYFRSIEKPFNFYQREQAKQRQKANEALYNGKPAQKKTNTFKANPVPKVVSLYVHFTQEIIATFFVET